MSQDHPDHVRSKPSEFDLPVSQTEPNESIALHNLSQRKAIFAARLHDARDNPRLDDAMDISFHDVLSRCYKCVSHFTASQETEANALVKDTLDSSAIPYLQYLNLYFPGSYQRDTCLYMLYQFISGLPIGADIRAQYLDLLDSCRRHGEARKFSPLADARVTHSLRSLGHIGETGRMLFLEYARFLASFQDSLKLRGRYADEEDTKDCAYEFIDEWGNGEYYWPDDGSAGLRYTLNYDEIIEGLLCLTSGIRHYWDDGQQSLRARGLSSDGKEG